MEIEDSQQGPDGCPHFKVPNILTIPRLLRLTGVKGPRTRLDYRARYGCRKRAPESWAAAVLCRFLSLVSSITIIGCASQSPPAHTSTGCCAKTSEPTAPTVKSVYELPGNWRTDTGQIISLSALSDRARVVAMFYASCEMTCPMTLEALRAIESRLPAEKRGEVGFVLITLDPQTDTLKALRRYRREHRLAEDRWTLLHGTPASVSAVAEALGVTYGRDNFRRLSHSSQISILDEEGQVLLQQPSWRHDFKPVVNFLHERLGHDSFSAQPRASLSGRPSTRLTSSRREQTVPLSGGD